MSQYYNTAAYPNASMQAPTPGLKALKNTFGSTLYLLATIFVSTTLLIALVSALIPGAGYMGMLRGILAWISNESGQSIPSEIDDMLSNFATTSFFSRLFSFLFTNLTAILVVLGMWLLWASARAAKIPSSTAGYTILQVVAIIKLVLACLGTLIVLIGGVIMLAGASYLGEAFKQLGLGEYSGSPTVIILLLLLFALIFCVLGIIYDAKLAGVYGACKDVLALNRPTKNISMYVIVFNFISIFFAIVSGIFSIVLTIGLTMMGGGFLALNGISTILGILAALFETIVFVKARGEFAALSAPAGTAGYNSYNFETGAYNTGSYQTAGYQAPYQTGSYPAQNAAYPQQTFTQPAAQQPSFDQNAYQQPSFDQNAYQQPSFDQNAYQQPSFDQNAYQQPSFDQNAYQQPQDNQQDVWSNQGQNQNYYGGQ